MLRLSLLVISFILFLSASAAPAPSALVSRDGPCDAFSETCRPVIQANACFAAFIRFGDKSTVLRCVDDQDEARAEELVSTYPYYLAQPFSSSMAVQFSKSLSTIYA
jgi:hypothetical protein